MTRDALITQLADHIRELVEPYQHAESVYGWTPTRNRTKTVHFTRHPPLLDQLRQAAALATPPRSSHIGRHRPDGTIPPPITTLAGIVHATRNWLTRLGTQPSTDLTADLRALVGAAPSLDHTTLHDLARDVADWHRQCSHYGGW